MTDSASTTPPEHECRDWEAWHDRMPGSPATLRVTGTCEVPSTGWRCELLRHEPPGFNPRDLLLDLVLHPPEGGMGGTMMSDVPCSFEEETDAKYDTVSILPNGPHGIEVKEVS